MNLLGMRVVPPLLLQLLPPVQPGHPYTLNPSHVSMQYVTLRTTKRPSQVCRQGKLFVVANPLAYLNLPFGICVGRFHCLGSISVKILHIYRISTTRRPAVCYVFRHFEPCNRFVSRRSKISISSGLTHSLLKFNESPRLPEILNSLPAY
jgi:hypothetical protein